MGLDMYLTRKIFIGAEYEHRNVKGKVEITIDDKPVDIDFKKISYIEEAVAYWRKANAIHNWFVQNVQDGEDDCKDYYVSYEKLKELMKTCNKVIQDNSKAEELLPSTSGFFFGGTDYDDWYFKSLEDTVKQIKEVLKREEQEIYYTSSW